MGKNISTLFTTRKKRRRKPLNLFRKAERAGEGRGVGGRGEGLVNSKGER